MDRHQYTDISINLLKYNIFLLVPQRISNYVLIHVIGM